MGLFYVVRHGETDWNVSGRIHGHTDAPLTAKGIKQAETLRQELQNISFTRIFSSDLGRALTTAEIIAQDRRIKVETDPLLRERNFGKYESLLMEQMILENKKIFDDLDTLSREDRLGLKFTTGSESDEEMANRLLKFFNKISDCLDEERVLIVAHGGPMKALLVKLDFLPHYEIYKRRFKNTGYIKLEVTKDKTIKIIALKGFETY